MRKSDDLKPMQPYFVLNSEKFYQEIYKQDGISHFYTFKAGENSRWMPVVPDGCIDIIFSYGEDGMEARVYGTVLSSDVAEYTVGRTYFGLRFLPGVMPVILNGQVRDFIACSVPLVDVLRNRELMDAMEQADTFYARITTFLQEYRRELARTEALSGRRELVLAVKDYVYRAKGKVRVKQLEDYTGYSSRYINKIFDAECGFNPKTFCKIIQFQRALEFLNYGAPDKMTDAAVFLGYYDQPQFIHDFSRYAGVTPKKYLNLVEEQHYKNRIIQKE